MAIPFWWLGHATTTTAKIVCRSTVDGPISASVNGTTFVGSSASASTNNGIAVVTVTGLSAHASYPFTLTDTGGAVVSGTLKTLHPSVGSVAFMSCLDRSKSFDNLAQNLVASGANAVVADGDYVYTSAYLSNYNQETAPQITTTSTVANYATHWRQCKRVAANRIIETQVPWYCMFDDHEFGGDDWDHTVTKAQAGGLNVAIGGTQAEVDASWWAARQAAAMYMVGNPDNPDVPAIGDKPSNAGAGTPASQYPTTYFRFTVGNIEVFVIDCISHRSPLAATDNASKTMLGATQKAWLKAALDSSTATFKIIASSKPTYGAGSNSDDWTVYTTERNELISYISANASGRLRSVVWIAGDAHHQYVNYIPSTGHIHVCANPAGVTQITQTAGYTNGMVWKCQGYNTAPTARSRGVFGLAESNATTLTLKLIDEFGKIIWTGSVAAGTNDLIGAY